MGPTSSGQVLGDYIVPAVAAAMRQAIGEADGHEVFFAGQLNGDGKVEQVRVCARGHDSAVPALFEVLGTRDVVMHNHPTGDVTPSDADLELAAVYSRHGHGVFIVDNAVERIRVVIEPFLPQSRQLLSCDELERMFRPAGALSRALPGFEVRPQQTEMLHAVAQAFNTDGIAVIEAPTGVGKTVAYLVPAVLWAIRNRERVVIATKTINLQEQIMLKDVPLVKRCLGLEFEAVLVKGRANYLCQQKLNRAFSETTLFDDEADQDELHAIAEWAAASADGSRSDLAFVPSRELWEKVCCEADVCLGNQCPTAAACFLTKARRTIATADLIVANHHMLFSDLAIKKELGNFNALAVLPHYRRVIIDEAHNVEDSATAYFGGEVSRGGLMMLLSRFLKMERGRPRGLLPFIKLKVMKDMQNLPVEEFTRLQELIDERLILALGHVKETVLSALTGLRELTADKCRQIGRDIKWRLTRDILRDDALRRLHSQRVVPAVEALRVCVETCTELLDRLRNLAKRYGREDNAFLLEISQLQGYRDRMHAMAALMAEGTGEDLAENTVRWVEIDAKDERRVTLARCPLDVALPLAEWVYPNLASVVMTSATLAVGQEFDYLFSRIGLDRLGARPIEAVKLDSPFDYRAQVRFCVPRDLPDPKDAQFLPQAIEVIRTALIASRGHAFVLFTSFYSLGQAYDALEGDLKAAGITPLRQGAASRTHLLDLFRQDTSSVLFATDSFWEGVDVAGDALQCVILTKLPFRVPSEPILEARAEAIEADGGDSFMEYSVPQAVIKFRQGFGRLIRRRTDRGVILVLDKRIVTRGYGRTFVASLPDVEQVIGDSQRVGDALREFFNGDNAGR